jgi:hypothetical protein
LLACTTTIGLLTAATTARADAPGRGLTAPFEVAFLKMAIDHHFAALRVTGLAAGTDATRDPELSPEEGTSPTPDSEPTGKASH